MKIRKIFKFGKTDPVKPAAGNVYSMPVEQVRQENPRNIFNLYVSEFLNLNKDNLLRYMEAARKGLNFYKSLLFEEIRRTDLQIGGICQTRKSSISNKEWKVEYDKRSLMGDQLKQEITGFIQGMLQDLNIQNFFTDIIEAQIQGVSTFEIRYAVEAGKIVVKDLVYIPNHLLCFDDILNEYRYLSADKADAMNLRLKGWTWEDRVDLKDLCIENIDKRKILEVHSLDGNAQNGFCNGAIDSLIWGYLWKHYGLTDWSTYIERFATPGIIVKYPQLMGKDDKNTLFDAVKKWGRLFKLIIPEGATFDTVKDDTKGQTSQLFNDYMEYWDSKMSVRVLGQTLTTGTGERGSFALGKVHEAVRADIAALDMMLVKDTLNKLIRRVCDFNYSRLDKYPLFSFSQEKDIDYKKSRAEIFKDLYQSGYKVAKENVEEEFDVKVEPVQVQQPSLGQGYINKFINEFFKNDKSGICE